MARRLPRKLGSTIAAFGRRVALAMTGEEPRYKRLEKLGEEYYDELYEGSGSQLGRLSEIKECFFAAIEAAREEGFRRAAKRLEARRDHIVEGYRRHFT